MPSPTDLLDEAQARERSGDFAAAIERYQDAIAAAERSGDLAQLAEALRRLAVLRHHRDDTAQARGLCRRSFDVARALGDDLLAAEALNTLGGVEMTSDWLEDARNDFLHALELGGTHDALRAKVEQNLGILANIQGDLDEAATRYSRALAANRRTGDESGCARAYHNLGMACADRELFDEAARYFTQSLEITRRTGDVYLQGLTLGEYADVHLECQRIEEARQTAEQALAIFDRLGAGAEKSGAYRVIGAVYRETSRPALAEARLRAALEQAVAAGSLLHEAEASRELALLCQMMGRNQEALGLLTAAHRLFRRLDARRDVARVGGKVAELEGTYLAVVREWGQSIESNDSYTFGHCERVAQNAVAVAKALGLDEHAQTTIRLGAYLHDVGKVRVPHEILNKPGPLTPEEIALVQRHPVWGIELLAGVEFPWDLKPIIQWHHERYDGSGYPDRLRGDQIPLAAQVVGLADVYDALTSTRSYRPALAPAQALAEITAGQGAWSPRVFAAFLQALPELSQQPQAKQGMHDRARSEQAA
jgi:putative nucleotidyltransferase with HDIG domain